MPILMIDAVVKAASDSNPLEDQLKTAQDLLYLLAHAVAIESGLSLTSISRAKSTDPTIQSQAPKLPEFWDTESRREAVYDGKILIKVDQVDETVHISGRMIGEGGSGGSVQTVSIDIEDLEKKLPTGPRDDGIRKVLSPGHLEEIIKKIHNNIILSLDPPDSKLETATEPTRPSRLQESSAHTELPKNPYRNDPFHPYPVTSLTLVDPPAAARAQPFPSSDLQPPRFDDEHEINTPLRPLGIPGSGLRGDPTGGRGLGLGHDDVNPPGLRPEDPLRASFTPGRNGRGGVYPSFGELVGKEFGDEDGDGGLGPGVPGARWDPVGPGLGMGMGGGRGRRGNGGFGGNRGFRGDSDRYGSGSGFGGGFGGGII